jgi:hypothetical protein
LKTIKTDREWRIFHKKIRSGLLSLNKFIMKVEYFTFIETEIILFIKSLLVYMVHETVHRTRMVLSIDKMQR